jgi:hypothetical protein
LGKGSFLCVKEQGRNHEANIVSLIKKPLVAPKKNKRKEKVLDPSKELLVHVDLHSSKKSNDGNDF